MTKNELEALARDAVRDADLHPREIPAIDLYLDQIICLVSDKLREASDRFSDRVLTKTMINNYSKDGLISPVKGKKYSKEQILQMLTVYSLKNTLSIGEIRRILQYVYTSSDSDATLLENAYTRFLEVKESERQSAPSALTDYLERYGLDPSDEEDYLVLILSLASLSASIKSTVQALLEAHYPDPDSLRAIEEQEKRAQAKRRKEEKKEEKKGDKSAADRPATADTDPLPDPMKGNEAT